MERSFRQYLLAGTMLAGGALIGGSITPASALVTTGACPSVGDASAGCDLIITLNPGGTGTITNGPSHGLSGGTFDGSDDTLIGVINNSGTTISTIHLTSALDIFGFDGDGAGSNPNPTSGLPGAFAGYSVATPAGENTATSHGPTYSGTDSTGANFNLSGPLNNYSGINAALNSGNVNFPGGLAAGGTAWFSLEEPLTMASFTVTPPSSAPEPATLSVLGAALAGFGLLRRRRKT
jgi:hypothetical protein